MIKAFLILALAAAYLMASPMTRAADAPKPADATTAAKGYKDVDVAEFDKLRKGTNVVVLDVRTRQEYEAGHIKGSVLLDFNAEDFEKEVAKLPKDKTYLVHCAAGGRSARACKKMTTLKFPHLFNLQGGFGAWEKEGKPVEK
jgi:phage shock protein E